MIESYFKSSNQDFTLLQGNCCKLLRDFDFQFDCIFADPPYFLSNGGISVQSGKVVNVNKGKWDKGKTPQEMTEFNMEWLNLCREKLKDNGSIWISGTYHNIFSIANCLTELGYKILNVVTWARLILLLIFHVAILHTVQNLSFGHEKKRRNPTISTMI